MDKIVNQGIEICIEEFQKKENKDKFEQEILDPIIKYMGERLWPYIMYSIVFVCILLVSIFSLLYTANKRSMDVS